MKKHIVGYGELLLRLTPAEYGNLIEQSDAFKIGFAGAEANIIGDLAWLGHRTIFLTALPQNPLGRKAALYLNGLGIETNRLTWGQGRLGAYYIEHGSSLRGTRVTYDRADSLMTKTSISPEDWQDALSGASHLVLTGITPSFSEVCRRNIQTSLEVSRSLGVKVVFDLNYRRTLWPADEARRSFLSILSYVDILCGNIGSAADVFGIQVGPVTGFESLKNATRDAADALSELGSFECIAMTMRIQQSAHENELGGMIKMGSEYFFSPSIQTKITDRLGGGDAFVAGLLHGIVRDMKPDQLINLASTAFAATQTLQGDINYLTEKEMENIAGGSYQGYVQR